MRVVLVFHKNCHHSQAERWVPNPALLLLLSVVAPKPSIPCGRSLKKSKKHQARVAVIIKRVNSLTLWALGLAGALQVATWVGSFLSLVALWGALASGGLFLGGLGMYFWWSWDALVCVTPYLGAFVAELNTTSCLGFKV